jgi:hypothetical protein
MCMAERNQSTEVGNKIVGRSRRPTGCVDLLQVEAERGMERIVPRPQLSRNRTGKLGSHYQPGAGTLDTLQCICSPPGTRYWYSAKSGLASISILNNVVVEAVPGGN